MRTDQHLNPVTLGISERQHYFLSAWFNMVHQHSLDAYRVRVMNPVNILRELQHMFNPPASDTDCQVVASEALEILSGHPVLKAQTSRYPSLQEAVALISDAVSAKEGFKKSLILMRSFIRELQSSLEQNFLEDCFTWMEQELSSNIDNETPEQRANSYAKIDRVCRDILSVAHDNDFSLESLFHLYRIFVPSPARTHQPPSQDSIRSDDDQPLAQNLTQKIDYDFSERFTRVRAEIMAEPRQHQLVFVITGCPPNAIPSCCGQFGPITISKTPPHLPDSTPIRAQNIFAPRIRNIFANATVKSRDSRSAGLEAYRQIGRILDLMRFEYDTPNIHVDTRFLFSDEDKYRLLEIPQLIPNPEAEPPTRSLQEFVEHLGSLAARDPSQTEASDRIFSAFRLYRQGTATSMFDNKLVNWWTGLEYLTNGGKPGGAIGEKVKNSLAPTITLTYLQKHLTAYRLALSDLNILISIDGVQTEAKECSNIQLYQTLKDKNQKANLEASCAKNPYLWQHLSTFIENISSPKNTAEMLKAHDRRVRWQIERIYRARCDIVHAAKQVVMASLLCANLEFYLRMTLKPMLRVFASVPTLIGPAEFFERQGHQYNQMMQALEPKDNKVSPSDAPIFALLD